MSFEDFKCKIKNFWGMNLTENYKKISIAIGTTLNMIISTITGYLINIIDPLWVGIIYSIQALANILIYSLFGRSNTKNEEVMELIASDSNLLKYIEGRIALKKIEEKRAKLKELNGGAVPKDYKDLMKAEKKLNKNDIIDSLNGLIKDGTIDKI